MQTATKLRKNSNPMLAEVLKTGKPVHSRPSPTQPEPSGASLLDLTARGTFTEAKAQIHAQPVSLISRNGQPVSIGVAELCIITAGRNLNRKIFYL